MKARQPLRYEPHPCGDHTSCRRSATSILRGRCFTQRGRVTEVEPEPVPVNRATLKLIERGDVEQVKSLLRRISRSVTEQ